MYKMFIDLTVILMSFLTINDINYHFLFNHYSKNFNKNYTLENFDNKFETFKNNVQYIFKHNQQPEVNFTLGINQFTDITNSEFKENFIWKDKQGFDIGVKCEKMEYLQKDTPESIDWREKNAVTSVKDQGQCGSCWSFSATGALEGINAIFKKILYSFSEQELVDCSSERPYGNHGCNGGLMDNAFKYTIDNGLCDESDYPYDMEKNDCKANSCVPKIKINKCFDVPKNNELAMKEAVSIQPVSVAIEADSVYFQSYKSGVITGDVCGTNLDHGVLVVGYGTENGVDYWLVKNSWSSSWGDQGYVKIERSDSTNSPGVCGIAMQPSYPSF